MTWRAHIRDSFRERLELSAAEMIEQYELGGAEDLGAVQEALSIFLEEYGVKPGLLRPSDHLGQFTDPPVDRNPIRWVFARAAYEDALGELQAHLAARLRKRGSSLSHFPETIGEYVSAWRGARSA